ncbi:MAG: sterol desaturase family protein [Planctomycetaceae bacterium]
MTPEQEAVVRLTMFVVVLLTMAIWEWRAPRRPRVSTRAMRWSNHAGLVLVNNLLLRLVVPISALQVAEYASHQHWGLLQQLTLPGWGKVAIALVLLDLVIYGQHVAFHYHPWGWRLHKVHHADLDFDVTSGVRFHTLEILLSLLIKCAAVIAIGAPPISVVLFEVILNGTSMFNHSNVAIPTGIDRWLRRLVVTPDMHRVHHSTLRHETDSNYGFNIPLWDRLFGTYRDQPERGHVAMMIGLPDVRDETRCERLDYVLTMPFRGAPTASAVETDVEQ